MLSSDGRYVLAYNGEVYNCAELRDEIENAWRTEAVAGRIPGVADGTGKPRRWRGHSDTEIVVEGCALFGTAFLRRLNGIFAIALYDCVEGTLTLARDRAGVKPLYIWYDHEVFLFASEAKFFFQHPLFRPEVSPEGLTQFVTYGHSTQAARMLKGVSQLAPGHELHITRPFGASWMSAKPERFCPPLRHHVRTRSPEGAAKELRQLLEHVVESQLVSDVPVGVFLSGGVDSSILTALAARALGPSATKAFTLTYAGCGADFDELAASEAVAKHLGVQHLVFRAKPEDLIARLEEVVWHYDEPFADAAALNVFALSELVRSHVTVALAGEGSDELFGGYRRYAAERLMRKTGPGLTPLRFFASVLGSVPNRLPRRLAILFRSLSAATSAERYSAYFENGISAVDLIQPRWQCLGDPRSTLRQLYPEQLDTEPVAALCLADQQFWMVDTYLEKSDKGSMAHSLEIRVPFLDNRMVEFANSLPDHFRIWKGQRKWLLRAAFADVLPAWVFTRFKRGFGVPVNQWFRKELRDYFAERVLGPKALISEYLRQPVLQSLHDQHCRGERDWSLVLWQALLFELWLSQVANGFHRPVAARDHYRV
jgi:asparagine synthase (glutamine-hydrolysing)